MPDILARRVAGTTLEEIDTKDLSGPNDSDVSLSDASVFGAYLQKLWMKDFAPTPPK